MPARIQLMSNFNNQGLETVHYMVTQTHTTNNRKLEYLEGSRLLEEEYANFKTFLLQGSNLPKYPKIYFCHFLSVERERKKK